MPRQHPTREAEANDHAADITIWHGGMARDAPRRALRWGPYQIEGPSAGSARQASPDASERAHAAAGGHAPRWRMHAAIHIPSTPGPDLIDVDTFRR